MRYFIKTYGCQYNEWEAARINNMLQKIGLVSTGESEADVIFMVACAVRQTAVDRLYGKLNNFPNKKVIITGCVLDHDKKKFLLKNAHIWDASKPESLKQILNIRDEANIANLMKMANSTSSFLPIMTGCNNFCTYCAVPYTKGREISRPLEDVVADFKTLLAKGEKKITLLGQNVNSYAFSFAKLLKTLNDLPGDFTIYFTSNHPKDMSDDVIKTIAKSSKVAKSIHLPIQAGSDKILKAMNRPYTRRQYLDLVKKIHSEMPDVEITTDVIVGFPGETEEDFQQTVDIFKRVKYQIAYVNKYSPRAGTAAYHLGDPIPWSEKQRRWKILDDIVRNK